MPEIEKKAFSAYNFKMRSEVEERIKTIIEHIKDKELAADVGRKKLMREYEKRKLDLKQVAALEQERAKFFKQKYDSLKAHSSGLVEEKQKLEELSKAMFAQIKAMQASGIVNEQKLEQKTDEKKSLYKKKIKEIIKSFIDKEVEYKSRIRSLNDDLKKYITETKFYKERYYARELELKEKIGEVLK